MWLSPRFVRQVSRETDCPIHHVVTHGHTAACGLRGMMVLRYFVSTDKRSTCGELRRKRDRKARSRELRNMARVTTGSMSETIDRQTNKYCKKTRPDGDDTTNQPTSQPTNTNSTVGTARVRRPFSNRGPRRTSTRNKQRTHGATRSLNTYTYAYALSARCTVLTYTRDLALLQHKAAASRPGRAAQVHPYP